MKNWVKFQKCIYECVVVILADASNTMTKLFIFDIIFELKHENGFLSRPRIYYLI